MKRLNYLAVLSILAALILAGDGRYRSRQR